MWNQMTNNITKYIRFVDITFQYCLIKCNFEKLMNKGVRRRFRIFEQYIFEQYCQIQ